MRLAATFFSPLRACLAGDSWWQPPLKSFNAEPQRAAMNALTCSVYKTHMHHGDCLPTVADCAGDGTCGSEMSSLMLLGYEFFRSGTRQEFRQPP